MKKNISILGSTGSIGIQTLDVIRDQYEHFNIIGLSTNKNIDRLEQQIKEFSPLAVCVMDEEKSEILRKRMRGREVEVYTGLEGLNKIASLEKLDLMINSLVGTIGIEPTITAIQHGVNIGLANKETLVSAGELVMKKAREKNIRILPIDSEHSAIFQCLQGNEDNRIEKILLTASGGPFKGKKKKELVNISPSEALKHPNWSMGKKISIDSATLMNKGLEVIEAKWLFDIDVEKIKVLVHPESIVHSAVEFQDGSVIAQLGEKDMRIPIAYALNYPIRRKNDFLKLDLISIGNLTFKEPDTETFECLQLAIDAIKSGGTFPAVLNAANEKTVELFLHGKIAFLDIPTFIYRTMECHNNIPSPTIQDILKVDYWAKEFVSKMAIKRMVTM